MIAILLVIVVVYIFLQGWRATLIPLLAVPVSLIGTFVFFPLFGFSINTLSLFGLVLAIGLVVDDAIVVVEAVERHIEDGLRPKAGGLQGDGGDLGPGDRHRAGAFGGVRADGIHSGHHRPAVSAIRGDHRDLGDPLGIQRAVAQSRARGADAEAEDRRARGLLREILRLVQPRLRARYQWLRPRGRARCFARARCAFLLLAGLRPWAACSIGSKLPVSFVPDEDQGYFYINVQLPNAASLQRTGRGDGEDRRRSWPRSRASSMSPAMSASAC